MNVFITGDCSDRKNIKESRKLSQISNSISWWRRISEKQREDALRVFLLHEKKKRKPHEEASRKKRPRRRTRQWLSRENIITSLCTT